MAAALAMVISMGCGSTTAPLGGAGGATATGGNGGNGTSSDGGANTGGHSGNAGAPQTCIPPASLDSPAAKLTQTGCVDPAHPTMLAASVIPYEVNSPLWSDGADKTRGMALPAGAKIHVKNCATEPTACPQGMADTGKWVFPVGTVLVKNFLFDGKFVETRLFIRFDQATWAGITYQWNQEQTDATLVPDDRVQASFNTGKRTVDWHYPNRIDCMKCHAESAGFSLGPETRQMNRMVGGINQIEMLQTLGLFDAPIVKPYQAALIAPYVSQAGAPPAGATLEQRARSYLHANCAICHRPDGDFPDLDMRLDIALKDTHMCRTVPVKSDLGVLNSLVLDPGKKDNSVMYLRMNTLPDPKGGKTVRMPQIASYVIDQEGTKLIGDWIASLTSCP
ncbi:MAG: hypothetical protein ABIS92_17955 [Polyangia bacterium]